MQTFLPYTQFRRSASVLDDRRLGKQRVEALQILRALHLEDYGWANHPAVRMWHGHTPALVSYGMAIVEEWVDRGHGDTTRSNIMEFVHPATPASQDELADQQRLPPWLGRPELHRSHRSALVRKHPEHYRSHFPRIPDDLDYYWPDPPADRDRRGDRDAWVVRALTTDGHISLPARDGEHPWVPLKERTGRITKRQRQIERFICRMRTGDLLVVPHTGTLHVAKVDGAYQHDDGQHRRPVRWIGQVERAHLVFPAALQDPQTVFALRDEPAIGRHFTTD